MKILVTGAAGFIGSNYVRYLLEHHDDYVVGSDLLTYAGNLNNLDDCFNYSNFKFVKLNICDKKEINKLFKKEKFNYVVNFAAEPHVDRSIEFVDDRKGHDLRYAIDANKIKNELGWSSEYRVDNKLAEVIKYYILKYSNER